MDIDISKLSRVTLVDESGRVYERFQCGVSLSVQDQGRTLKVFVKHDPSKSLGYISDRKREHKIRK